MRDWLQLLAEYKRA
ncbi:hypothetical protein AVEN_29376-1, partial [Araneus ventricosus]